VRAAGMKKVSCHCPREDGKDGNAAINYVCAYLQVKGVFLASTGRVCVQVQHAGDGEANVCNFPLRRHRSAGAIHFVGQHAQSQARQAGQATNKRWRSTER